MNALFNTAASNLPQELVDEILAELHDDKESLSNCSVVRKSWALTARRHLFRTISLDAFAMPTRQHEVHTCAEIPDWMAFVRAFEASPGLAAFVRDLRIYGGALPESKHIVWLEEFAIDHGEEGEIFWGTNYTCLALDELFSIAVVLPELEHVLLENIVLRMVAHQPSHPIALQSLSLISVAVLDGANVLDIFDVFSPTKDVCMRVLCKPCGSIGWPEPTHTPLGLTATTWFVRCQEEFPFLCHLTSTTFTQHVRSLDINIDGLDTGELLALLSILRASPNLTTLRLDLRYAFWSMDSAIYFNRKCLSNISAAYSSSDLGPFISASKPGVEQSVHAGSCYCS